jgi:hypothetical protein
MVSLRILPDALTYDRMMLVCLKTPSTANQGTVTTKPDYEDGVKYYQEMRAKGFQPRFESALVLVRTLTRWGDGRVDGVLDELEGMDLPIRMGELRKWVGVNFGKEDGVEGLAYKGVKEG